MVPASSGAGVARGGLFLTGWVYLFAAARVPTRSVRKQGSVKPFCLCEAFLFVFGRVGSLSSPFPWIEGEVGWGDGPAWNASARGQKGVAAAGVRKYPPGIPPPPHPEAPPFRGKEGASLRPRTRWDHHPHPNSPPIQGGGDLPARRRACSLQGGGGAHGVGRCNSTSYSSCMHTAILDQERIHGSIQPFSASD
ncbi:MAG: hypothetical protein FD153_1537 [Rhodospirillaceae bacterium]|nr:MAG: hypothetical protein FD153_1537 [Rhodospirillaceae bacterium]